MEAEELLLIIVSTTLTVFLIVATIVFVLAIKLIQQVRRIVSKAENIADKAAAVSDVFQKAAVPAAIGKVVSSFSEVFRNRAKSPEAKGGKR